MEWKTIDGHPDTLREMLYWVPDPSDQFEGGDLHLGHMSEDCSFYTFDVGGVRVIQPSHYCELPSPPNPA